MGLGSGGGSGADTAALASLLGLLSDPEAAKARLRELLERTKEAESLAAQVQQDKVDLESLHKEIAKKQTEIEKLTNDLSKKEVSLDKKLVNAADKLDASNKAKAELRVEKEAFAAERLAAEADLAQREQAVKTAETQCKRMLDQAQAEITNTIAERRAELEAELKQRLEKASTFTEEAVKKNAEASAALAEAHKMKEYYETRIVALKKILTGEAT